MSTEAFTYVPLVRRPAVLLDDVEAAHDTVEVRVQWGTTTLQVAHVDTNRGFHIGEASERGDACDYCVPERLLGARRIPLVCAGSGGGGLRVVIPPFATVDVSRGGCDFQSSEDETECFSARPSREWPGAREIDLPGGAEAHVELVGTALSFHVSIVKAGKRLPGGALASFDVADALYGGLSMFLHLGLMAMFAFLMPGMAKDGDSVSDREAMLTMAKLLDAAAEREANEVERARDESTQEAGATSSAEKGAAGATGALGATHEGRRAIAKSMADRSIGQAETLREASSFGAIELLGAIRSSAAGTLRTSWSRDVASGDVGTMAWRHLFGTTIDDAAGTGFDLAGTDQGERGAELIDVRDIAGLAPSAIPGGGIAAGRGPRAGAHEVRAPRVRDSVATVNGRVPPEVIQRTVRQSFGRFRFCYETGLRVDPALRGRVVVRFVIGRSGAVELSMDAGSEIADTRVTQCVVRAFSDISFPAPEGGIVTVVYPIMFSADDPR